jgi:hypothetical protein
VDFKGRVYTNTIWIRLAQEREQLRYLAERPVDSQDETVKYPSVCLCPSCPSYPKWRVLGKKMAQKEWRDKPGNRLLMLMLHAWLRVQDDFFHHTKSNGTVKSTNTQSPYVYGNNCDEICLH